MKGQGFKVQGFGCRAQGPRVQVSPTFKYLMASFLRPHTQGGTPKPYTLNPGVWGLGFGVWSLGFRV